MLGKRRQKDTDARWTKKHGKSYFGYKVSANADKRYKLVRKIKVSTASERDTTHFEDLLDPANTNRNILADKGYVDGEREARLSKQGWRMHIQHGCRLISRNCASSIMALLLSLLGAAPNEKFNVA